MRDNNSPFSEEWQDETVRRARFNNAIMLNELIYVMAYEEKYNGILFDLWEVLGLNENKKIRFPYNPHKDYRLDKYGNLKFKEDRAGVWFYLWSRIARTESGQFFFSKLSILAPIDLYYDVSCLKKVEQDKDRSEAHFIKLDELAAYLEKIKEIYGLLIPLPAILYPNPPSQPEQDASLDDGENNTGGIISHNEQRSPKSEEHDPASSKDFINRLKVSKGSNSGIEIKEPGKSPKAYDYKDLEFKSERTKEWKAFLEVLGNKDHVLSLGSAGRFYDAQQKILIQINKKLMKFFIEKYSLRLPHDFKLYELCKDGRSGTYRFKFQVVDNFMDSEKTDSEYRNKTKEQLLKEFEQLAEKYQMRPEDEEITEKMAKLSKVLLQKEWITEAEIGKIIKESKPETEIKHDPYENVKGLPPQY